MIERDYNIHSILSVRARGNEDLVSEIDLHIGAFRCEPSASRPDVLIEGYDSFVPPRLPKTVVDDYEYDGGTYHRAASRFAMNLLERQQSYFMDRLMLPINLIIELALLRKGYTFLHGAGMMIDGRRVLFPAYPGTGKTTLVAGFVHSGARLFGDDLCIIGNGQIFSFPQSLSVYEHHLAVLRYEDAGARKAFRKTAFLDGIVRRFFSGRSRVSRLMRVLIGALRVPAVNVDPVVVFGPQSLAEEGPLDEVCVLERSGTTNELVLEDVELRHAARQASFILLHEWHASSHDLMLYDAMSESDPRWTDRTDVVSKLAHDAFSSVRCRRIRIPARWNNQKLVAEFAAFWRRNL